MPRRQREQQRQLRRALRTALPTVAGFCIPFFGYAFILVGITAPRLLLSKHFFNHYQIQTYAADEYRERRTHYNELANQFWGMLMINVRTVPLEELHVKENDAAGPVFANIRPLANIFFRGQGHGACRGSDLLVPLRGSQFPDFNTLPREHLVTLAFSAGASRFPSYVNSILFALLPSFVIRRKLLAIAEEIVRDDILLVEEMQDKHGCVSLSDDEIFEACLLRGLPCTFNVPPEEKRKCLTNYLSMVSQVHHLIGTRGSDRTLEIGLKLFILHLPAIRFHLMQCDFARKKRHTCR